jgi:hypothetical protein
MEYRHPRAPSPQGISLPNDLVEEGVTAMSPDANVPGAQEPLDKANLVRRIIKQIQIGHAVGITPTIISMEVEPLWREILMQAPEDMLRRGEVYTSELEAYVSKELVKRSKR